jgi:hypothetical protein
MSIPEIMGGHRTKYDVHHYLFTFKFLKENLEKSGFKVIKSYAGFSLENYIKHARIRNIIKKLLSHLFKYRSMNLHILAVKVE